jgi:hypothetical protein
VPRGAHTANEQHIRARLKDSALQSLLSEIDSCSDAERALDQAMLEPRFQLFADEVRASRSRFPHSTPTIRPALLVQRLAVRTRAVTIQPSITSFLLLAPCSSQHG